MQRMLCVFVLMASLTSHADGFEKVSFKVLGDCAKPTSVWFRQLDSEVDLGQDAKGRPLRAAVGVQLFSDHTYWLEYSESVVTQVVDQGETLSEGVFATTQQGVWSAEGSTLRLDNQASGVLFTVSQEGRDANAVAFKFAKNFHDSRFSTQPVTATSDFSNTGPKGISINQYCHRTL